MASQMASTPRRGKICVLGAGPIGIEMALRMVRSKAADHHVVLVERGSSFASNVAAWSFVRFFSSWSLNTTPLGLEVLAERGFDPPPPDVYPTGAEYIKLYLEPLWDYLKTHDRCTIVAGASVVSVSRGVMLKSDMGTDKRRAQPFRILVSRTTDASKESGDGIGGEGSETETIIEADSVVDATGTYGHHNWLGAGGIPALGERSARRFCKSTAQSAPLIEDVIPDVLSKERRGDFLGKKVIVLVGSGYSAVTTLDLIRRLHLDECEKQNGDIGERGVTTVVWATRRSNEPATPLYERISNDPLPARDALSGMANGILNSSSELGHGSQVGVKLTPSLMVRHLPNVVLRRVHRNNPILTSRLHSEAKKQKIEAPATPLHLEFVTCKKQHADDAPPIEGSEENVVAVECDRVIANVGYRPDASLYQELQVHQCYASEGPMKLAAALLSASGAGSSAPSRP